MSYFIEENVAKNMDNIRDRWNEVNGKSLHVDKQTFIEKITPYCMHKWSFKEWMWCWFLKLSNSILAVLGGNIACYCCYIANQTGCSWTRTHAGESFMYLESDAGDFFFFCLTGARLVMREILFAWRERGRNCYKLETPVNVVELTAPRST